MFGKKQGIQRKYYPNGVVGDEVNYAKGKPIAFRNSGSVG